MPFQVGHEYIKPKVKGGRPKGSKNLLPLIRDKVLYALEKRLSGKKALRKISTEDLLKFAQSIMPKDLSIRVAPDFQYISNTPRPTAIDVTPQPQQVEYKNQAQSDSVKDETVQAMEGDDDDV